MTEAATKFGCPPLAVRTVVLIRGIPTMRAGRAQVLDDKGMKLLEAALADVDKEAKARGMTASV